MFRNDHTPPRKRQQITHTTSTTTFQGPYNLPHLNGKTPGPLHRNDIVQLLDDSLLSIIRFEQEITMSSSQDDEIKIQIFVYGTRYERFQNCEDFGGFLADFPTEVYKSGKKRYPVDQIRRKVTLVRTNKSHPFANETPEKTRFVCRYSRSDNTLTRLSMAQADEGLTRADDTEMRNIFLHNYPNPPSRNPTSKYRFGDGFCGVGGTSSGAEMAGLKPVWAFDGDARICNIYSENFPRSDVWNANVNEFLTLRSFKTVDVLHMSPPCQTWSAAHTIPGKDDDKNSSALFSIDWLLKQCRPRVSTLEQVPGLSRTHTYRSLFLY